MFDLRIDNGRVIDGTGNVWYSADIAVLDGKIVRIKAKLHGKAKKTINAKGLVVAPGFIDTHSHSDNTVLENPLCKSFIMQGITSAAVGMCGSSVYGVNPTLAEWRSQIKENGVAMNLVPFMGHRNPIRSHVLGERGTDLVMPTDQEMEEMKALVAKGMEDGAFGMSSGLSTLMPYPEETIELCKVVADYGGIWHEHMRNGGETVIEGVDELIRVSEKSGVRAIVSHLHALCPENWGKPVEGLRKIDAAREKGIEVFVDVYPWHFCAMGNALALFVPGGTTSARGHGRITPDVTLEGLLKDIKDPTKWEEMKKEVGDSLDAEYKEFRKRQLKLLEHGIKAPDPYDYRFYEVVVRSKTHPELIGKYLWEVAAMLKMDWRDAIRKVIIDDEGETFLSLGGYSEDDVIEVLKHPTTTIECDASARDKPMPIIKPEHPRGYGSFARVIERYVREKRIFPLREAVKKMTSLGAQHLGVTDRGLITEGKWADITIFDPETVKDKATFEAPSQYPEGIHYVIVNGVVTVDKGKHTNARAGKVLKKV
jgi:N-acyl-D-amino-acid deacylase